MEREAERGFKGEVEMTVVKTILKILKPIILPMATRWCSLQRDDMYSKGRAITTEEAVIAFDAGVVHPSAMRVIECDSVPLPDNWLLLQAGKLTGLYSQELAGMTIGDCVYVNRKYISDGLLGHEFTHVAQYQKAASMEAFLSRYINEMIEYGYSQAPMEIEARNAAQEKTEGR